MAAVLFPKAEVVLSQPWTEIFHRNRNQYTYIGNYCSVVAEVRYGLLQGFVLEPLLFLIYIIDICRAVPKANVKSCMLMILMNFCLIKMVENSTVKQTCVCTGI